MSSKTRSSGETGAGAALVPKLRFPEFRDDGAWRIKPFERLFTIGNGRDHKHLSAGEVPVYGSGGFMRLVDDHLYEGESACIGRKGTIDNPIFLKGKFWTVDTLFYTHSFKECLPKFIFAIFQQIDWRKHNEAGGVPSLSKANIEKIKAAVPSLPEQQKIADCLDSVDALIAAQGRKVETLKAHKKGLMQQLFPQEGEALPRLRFPEFEGAGEWEEGTISDIGTVLQGYGFPERYQGQQNGDFPFYKVSDISRSLGAGKTFIEEAANYVNKNQLKELRAKPIPAGTAVFAKIGEAIRSNKRAITTVPCLIDNNAAGVKSIKGKATDFFIYLTMEQISLIDHAGGVVPAVNKSAIEAIPVKFPQVAEQQRIADCLTSLDDLIAAETRKLDRLKTHKKGLMQQLFPRVGEADT